MNTEQLAKVIQDNPGCFLLVDNDQWHLYKRNPFDSTTDEEQDDIMDNECLARDDDLDGESMGCVYGFGVLVALAGLHRLTVETV